jgi:hypothetical protein
MTLTLSEIARLDASRSNDERRIGGDATMDPADGRTPRRFDRREFTQMVMAAGMAAGITVLGWIPQPRPASAGHTTYSIHSNCAGINYGSYAGSTGCCSCGSQVHSAYCAGNNWHRHDTVSGSGYSITYSIRTASCDGRNAWRWTRSGNQWRCSDGRARTTTPSGSSTTNTVCPRRL